MTLIETFRRYMQKKKMERENYEELPDEMTRDRYLRSLRRERRIQMEEVEKETLKKQIAQFRKQREEKYLWGMHNNILRQPNSLLQNNKPPIRRKRYKM